MSNVEQEADNSKRNSEEIDTTSFDLPSRGKSSRKHLKPTTGQPDASNSTSSRELQ
ncbi:glutamate receptor 2.1-like [Dorcoceras hygrometricum]|uniref:Glutamate receptor 2.1-like n=1 Tax=Dorcoceras hygrometricum TaxID=472368 RepID=A0A2Z6ZYF6_9LAMI|nr:glutamate receptor 2.1-like [Dorcoceras hygrometricum]